MADSRPQDAPGSTMTLGSAPSNPKGIPMSHHVTTRWLLLASPLLIAACTLSLLRPPVQTAPDVTETAEPSTPGTLAVTDQAPLSITPPAPTNIPAPAASQRPFCDDLRPPTLIDEFQRAIKSGDGALLASLISPEHGMDARLLRGGRVVNYDREHAAALFESTYIVDWGVGAGSGLPIRGSFRDLFLPDLMDVFSREYLTACNSILLGGTTYSASWPYDGVDFYSLYYPGSAEFSNLDWHTWVIGIQLVDDEPYLYAIMQFDWEP